VNRGKRGGRPWWERFDSKAKKWSSSLAKGKGVKHRGGGGGSPDERKAKNPQPRSVREKRRNNPISGGNRKRAGSWGKSERKSEKKTLTFNTGAKKKNLGRRKKKGSSGNKRSYSALKAPSWGGKRVGSKRD